MPLAHAAGVSQDDAVDPWWQLYHDPALDSLVSRALVDNRELRIAAARLQQARALQRETNAQSQPQTSTNVGGGYGTTLTDQIEAASEQRADARTGGREDAGLDVEWELDLFGRLRSARRASQANAAALAAAEAGARVLIAAETTRSYLDACGFAARLAVATRSLGVVRHGLDLTERLAALGAAVPLDVARAHTLVERTAADIPPLEAGRQRAMEELAVLVGTRPDRLPEEAERCDDIPQLQMPIPTGDGLALLRRRPDVRQAKMELAGATAGIGVATADLFPSVSLSGSLESSAHDLAGLGARKDILFRIGPLLTWSFPNISATRARIALAKAKESEALARFDSAILGALKDVDQALTAYDAALRRREALRTAVASSGEALRLARIGRTEGATTSLEEVDAERADVDARTALASQDLDVAEAQIELFKALGGGWRQAPPLAPQSISRIAAAARPTIPNEPRRSR